MRNDLRTHRECQSSPLPGTASAAAMLLWALVGCDGTSGPVLTQLGAGDTSVSTAGSSGETGSGGQAGVGIDAGPPPSPPDDPLDTDAACTPLVVFENRDATAKGQIFSDAISDPEAVVQETTRTTCRILFRNANEVPAVPTVNLLVEDYDGIAGTSGTQIRLSTNYLNDFAATGGDVATEIRGILYFAASFLYQQTAELDWIDSGTADFVRLRAGYLSIDERTAGGAYTDGFRVTAYFFGWIDDEHPDFVYRLNQSLVPPNDTWSLDTFVELTGSDVDMLWAEYQATL